MRTTLNRSKSFKRDFKRELRTHGKDLVRLFDEDLLPLLLADTPPPSHYKDHTLTGDWDGCRECHIKPDLLLIYEKPDTDTLSLARLGSHSELFG